jgi:hypothetical protein
MLPCNQLVEEHTWYVSSQFKAQKLPYYSKNVQPGCSNMQ